jgi:hypothetical protein
MKTRFYMKRNLSILLFACLGIFSGNSLHAQLVAGDIAFTGYNADVTPATGGPYDSFSFVVLRVGGLPASTVINFTDCGWTNTSACGSDQFYPENGSTEATITWQSPGSVLAYGTQVTITGPNASAGAVTSAGNTAPVNVGLTLTIAGDQIIAFQGTRASNTIIAAIHANVIAGTTTDAGWDVGSASSTSNSNIPPCLTNGLDAVIVYSGANILSAVEMDNARLTCFTASGNRATDLAYCNNRTNWVLDDATIYTLPPAACASPLSATQSQVNLTCNGVCTGQASVVASGGTAPYTYAWSPSGGSGATASSLCAGNYTCTITDAASNSITKTFNITQPPAIVVSSVSQTNVSCFGGSNGAAQVSASGGTGTLTYNWTPGNPTGDGTNSVSGLTANSWVCTVTDANSCTGNRNFTITQPPALVVTPVSQTNVSCNGGSNGAASVSASGGQTGYSYNWTPGNPTGDGTASVTGLTAGNWTCTVTDANACTGTANFNITAPTAIVVTPVSQTNVSCNGGSNGAASVSASGGASGFTYNWTPGNPTGDGTASVTGLTAGNWTCTVTDANACTGTANFNITAPTAIVVTPVSQTNVSCNGGSNGAASVSASGGASGFTYNWTPGNPTGDGTASVTGLTAGNWTCTVTDANACVNTATFNITAPTAIVVTPVSQTNVSCNGGSNGAASVSASGGASGFTYNWTPGNPTGDGTASVTGLTAGNWTCTVTDANACVKTATFNITAPTAIVVTPVSQTNVSCNGGSNGAASVSASGGASGFTYNWTPGNPTGDGTTSVTGLTAGNWTCTVTDANGCVNTATFNITAPGLLTASSTASSILCNGGMSTVTVSATGGTGAYTGVGTFTAIAGTQTYTVSDVNGCMATTSVSITEPTLLTANSSASSILCNGGMSTVTVSATGGTSAYTGTGTFTAMAGPQSYTVSDANGCTTTTSVSITEPAAITASLSYTLCQGQSVNVATSTYSTAGTFTDVIASLLNGCDSTITTTIMINALPNVTVNSGAICAGESYTLVPNGAVSYTYSSGTDVITPSSTDTYTVTGTDANGCVNSAVSSVTVNALPNVSVVSATICAGATGTLTASGADTYTWSTGSNSNEISDNPASTTVYIVSGTSPEGCPGSAVNATITVGAAPSIVVSSESMCAGGSATLTASGVTTYTWSTGENTSTIVVSPTTNTVYTVSGDLAGCSVQASNAATVTVNSLPNIAATTNNTLLCTGETATLSATGATTYTWSTTENTADIAVSPTSTTTYTVEGTDGNGCSNMATITQDVSTCTGIAQIASANAVINVYPNPNTGLFNIELSSDAKVVITNSLGQVIVTEEMSSGKHELDIHNQADGIYFIKVIENSKQHTLKFIKK